PPPDHRFEPCIEPGRFSCHPDRSKQSDFGPPPVLLAPPRAPRTQSLVVLIATSLSPLPVVRFPRMIVEVIKLTERDDRVKLTARRNSRRARAIFRFLFCRDSIRAISKGLSSKLGLPFSVCYTV